MNTVLLQGPFNGSEPKLSSFPPQIEIQGYIYLRIDDPETGEYLGAYYYPE